MRQPRTLSLLVALALFFSAPPLARAVTVTLAWDPYPTDAGPLPDGFRLYYGPDTNFAGTEAVQGPSPIDIPYSSLADPSAPSFEIDGLSSCTVVVFGLSAYALDGDGGILESSVTTLGGITVIQRPKNIVATSPTAGAIHLAWDALPSNDHGTIASFDVHYGSSYDPDGGQPIDGAGANEGASPVSVSNASPLAPVADLGGLLGGTYFVSARSICAGGESSGPAVPTLVVVGSGTTTSTSGSSSGSSSAASGSGSGSGSSGSSSTASSSSSSSSTGSSGSSGSTSSTSSSTSTSSTTSTSTGSTTGRSTTSSTSSTGSTAGSTGSASSSSSSGSGSSGGAANVAHQIDGSCGCTSDGDAGSAALLIALLAWANRRRR